jgi:hypothetical protein
MKLNHLNIFRFPPPLVYRSKSFYFKTFISNKAPTLSYSNNSVPSDFKLDNDHIATFKKDIEAFEGVANTTKKRFGENLSEACIF